jgi:ATP-binding cassette subfamily B protein
MHIPLKEYWSLLFNYLRPQWRRASLLGVLLLTSIGLQLVNPQFLRRFIDEATAGGARETLLGIAALYISFALANQLLSAYARYVGESVGWTATNLLRADLAAHCLKLDMAFQKTRTPGEMIERIDGDVNALSNFFSQFIFGIAGNMILLVGVLVLLYSVDWRVGLGLTVFAAAALFIMFYIRKRAVGHWTAVRQANAEYYGFLGERLAGTEDIRSSGAVTYVMRRFHEMLRRWIRLQRRAQLWGISMWMTNIVIFALGTAVAFALSAYLWTRGEISIGTAYLIFNYTELIRRPLEQIRTQMQDLQKAGASITRVRGLFETESRVKDGPGRPLPAQDLSVEFHGVCFAYEDDREPVLEGLEFNLQPGKVLGLLGRTGSGKTTLARLLFRLHDPTGGEIRLSGLDIREATLGELRRRVGMVTQDVQLFHASVRDNLAFFDRGISDERIVEVLEDLGLSAWYRALPAGLDTELLSGNTGLSAGEAQLLAFARLFLTGPAVVVLDEASSRLDPATEELLERAVDKVLEGRTGIIIAHRLATVHRADEILILENGRILEHGPRRELADDPRSRFHHLLLTGLEELLA